MLCEIHPTHIDLQSRFRRRGLRSARKPASRRRNDGQPQDARIRRAVTANESLYRSTQDTGRGDVPCIADKRYIGQNRQQHTAKYTGFRQEQCRYPELHAAPGERAGQSAVSNCAWRQQTL